MKLSTKPEQDHSGRWDAVMYLLRPNVLAYGRQVTGGPCSALLGRTCNNFVSDSRFVIR